MLVMSELEKYFDKYRNNIVGINASFETPYGTMPLIYADWIASGRLYAPIEDKMLNLFGPMVGNTHSEAIQVGKTMTQAYHLSQKIIKQHVNASSEDVIIAFGSGMTGCINKMQRILGLRVPEAAKEYCNLSQDQYSKCKSTIKEEERPIVFLTHVEHHSNHTSWYETFADVIVLQPTKTLLVDVETLRKQLEKYKNRKTIIGSFSACSNVSGYIPPYHQLAKLMHEYGGVCFIDFAASAPYLPINMHPADDSERLDAIFFSPHKFLGGPGSVGVMVFNKSLYKNEVPDHPGGGTVNWTNPWGQYSYVTDIEAKEDGGTPAFLQTIRAALCIKLKEEMSSEKMHARENELIAIGFEKLRKIKKLHILADNVEQRLGVFSFYVDSTHHNLIVKLLNDRFGIQVRGGCSCAGTYGHFMLKVNIEQSNEITNMIDNGDLSLKPGWVRLSLHPTMTNSELLYICDAIKQVVENVDEWKQDYDYSPATNEFYHRTFAEKNEAECLKWFEV